MKKKQIKLLGILLLTCTLFCGCSDNSKKQESDKQTDTSVTETASATETSTEQEENTKLSDGVYTVDFNTDSSMFHVSEACDGKGTLTVKNGEMTVHISLGSKKIVNLYPGLAEDAKKDGAELLLPTTDTVTYSDGTTEEVYGFDVPVPAVEEEFDLALIGTKGKWYDHKVSVSNPKPSKAQTKGMDELEDGTYTIDLTLEGGSGKATILSPATITVSNKTVTAKLQWSSPNYDYMILDEKKYLPINKEGNSVFEVPVQDFDKPIAVIGDTVAMSKPHEVEYTLTFHSDTIKGAK